MKVELKIDENCEETKVVIYAKTIDEEISKIVETLQSKDSNTLNAFIDEEMYILNQDEIQTIYAEESKVFAKTDKGQYLLKRRLYELENILNKKKFIRISNSEIVNIKKVEKINFKLTGTIVLHFKNGDITYVSRRYIKRIKEFLGL